MEWMIRFPSAYCAHIHFTPTSVLYSQFLEMCLFFSNSKTFVSLWLLMCPALYLMCPVLYYSCGGCEFRGQHAWMLLEVAPHSFVVFVRMPCCAVTRHDSQCWNLCVAVADRLQWNSSLWPLACQIAAQVCFCSGPRHLSCLLIWILFLHQSEARVQLCHSPSPPVFPITLWSTAFVTCVS